VCVGWKKRNDEKCWKNIEFEKKEKDTEIVKNEEIEKGNE